MKVRNGFVSNSSSSSFLIYNKTDNTLSLADFVKENGEKLLEGYLKAYCYDDKDNRKYFSFKNMMEAVGLYDYVFPPKSQTPVCFGDEHGNVLGAVFDYMLRDVSESKNFKWICIECRGTEYSPPRDWCEPRISPFTTEDILTDFCDWLNNRDNPTIFGKLGHNFHAPLISEYVKNAMGKQWKKSHE